MAMKPRFSRTLFGLTIRWDGGSVIKVMDKDRVIMSRTLRNRTFEAASAAADELEQDMMDDADAMGALETRP